MGAFTSHLRRAAVIAMGVALPLAAPAATAPAAPAEAPVPEQRVLYQDGPGGRYLLQAGWTTRGDPTDAGLKEGWQAPGHDAGFTPVTIPNAFNAHPLDARGFQGHVQWYRVRFTLPDDAGAVAWRLRFESVGVGAMVFLNGRLIGRHRGPALPFEVPASGIGAGGNELEVRVDGRSRPSDLPPSSHPRGWWNFAGILREVYLRRVGALDIERVRVRVRLGPPGRVRATAVVRNASGQPQEAAFSGVDLAAPGVSIRRSPPGAVAPGARKRISATVTIPAPRLWSPRAPNLYPLRLTVPGGQLWTVHVGLRRWGHDRRGRLLLNGR
ncbi:MAG: sugar-binding domain-containing protein, partial [Anaeromyxobacteraceae bacterium]